MPKSGVGSRCSRCRETKPVECFRFRHGSTTQRLSYCYDCHLAYSRERQIRVRRELRAEALAVYGGQCQCCGELEQAFLVIDHVNGGGLAERRKFGSTDAILRDLKKRGWPAGYQTLCANCNMAKERIGGCPHGKP